MCREMPQEDYCEALRSKYDFNKYQNLFRRVEVRCKKGVRDAITG